MIFENLPDLGKEDDGKYVTWDDYIHAVNRALHIMFGEFALSKNDDVKEAVGFLIGFALCVENQLFRDREE